MRNDLRSKLFLSYVVIILATLILLSGLVDLQISKHVQNFYNQQGEGILLPPGPKGELLLDAIRHSTLLTALGAGALAIFVSFFVTGYITRPIKKVIEATKAIARGKYEERVPVETTDELGDLTRSLNSMAKSLQSHRYLEQQLITNVSHELATPLTNIGGYLEALADEVIKEEKRAETYALMKEEVERLKSMLEEVRTLSTAEQAQFQVKPATVNIKELTEKIIKQIQPQFEEKEIPLALECTLKTNDFVLDKDRYTQILLNLLNNALQYSSANKPVTVRLTPVKGGLELAISDQGVGISEKELPYIFERFYRTDQSRNRKTGGLGVGLAIVKELVEAHHGTIAVTSQQGKGTTFTLYFPKGTPSL